MSRILCIVPRKIAEATHKSGVGTYIEGLRTLQFVDFLCEDSTSDLAKSNYFKYAYSQVIDYTIVAFLQTAILKKLEDYPYTAIVCSTFEACEACIGLGLPKFMPIYYRTHNGGVASEIRVIGDEKIIRLLATANQTGIRVLANCTQTLRALQKVFNGIKGSVALNVTTTLPKFKQPKVVSGTLYISRFDDVKQPKQFAILANDLPKPIKIMTNSVQAAKSWRKLLLDHKIDEADLDIRYGLTIDKWDFIASAAVAVSTSKAESFGLGILETLPFCPTIILKSEYAWHKNFEDFPHLDNLYVAKDEKEFIALTRKKSKIPKNQIHEIFEDWNKLTVDTWVDLLRTARIEDAKATKSEISTTVTSGGVVDWRNYPVLQRTLKAFHQCNALYDLTFKGAKFRMRRR